MEAQAIRGVASGQKLAILAVVLGLVGNLYWPAMFLTVPLMLYAIYRLARALGYSALITMLLMLAMFVPLVGLVCLLVVNAGATRRLREAGVRVGLLGASAKDLPEEERAAS
jgi:hypothetical protein